MEELTQISQSKVQASALLANYTHFAGTPSISVALLADEDIDESLLLLPPILFPI